MVGIEISIGNVEELLVETNDKLSNIELLLEFLLTPPDLVEYMKQKKAKTISDN
jgi:hypothetical protein